MRDILELVCYEMERDTVVSELMDEEGISTELYAGVFDYRIGKSDTANSLYIQDSSGPVAIPTLHCVESTAA